MPPEEVPQQEQQAPQSNLKEKFPLETRILDHGTVSTRAMRPDIFRPHGEIPVVPMGGWTMNQLEPDSSTKKLLEKGQSVTTFDIVKGTKRFESPLPAAQLKREADTIREWILSSSNEKITPVCQSLSAIVILKMIEDDPSIADKLNGVILLSPMGLSGKNPGGPEKIVSENEKPEKEQSFRSSTIDRSKKLAMKAAMAAKPKILGKRLSNLLDRKFAEDNRSNAIDVKNGVTQDPHIMEMFNRFWSHHAVRMAQEGIIMTTADEANILNLLKANGIKVGIIQGADDLLNSSKGVTEHISRQAASANSVSGQFRDEQGVEKIPDELQIKEEDSDQTKQQKRQAIFAIKQELQKTENRVPLDSLTFVEGGHEITGREATAMKILRMLDEFNNSRTNDAATTFAKEYADMAQSKRVAQSDEEAISKAREDLRQLQAEQY